MDKKISRLNIANATVLLVIFVLLDEVYKHIIVEVFGYMGFIIGSFNLFTNILSYVIVVFAIFIINFTRKSLFSGFILELIALFLLFPSIILYKDMHTDPEIVFAQLTFFLTAFVSLKYIKIRIKGKSLKNSQKAIFLFIIVVIMIIPFFLKFKTHVNLKNFLLEDIYKTRIQQRELNNMYLAYTYSWLAKVIIPIAIVIAIAAKSRVKSIILAMLLAYLFLVGAHKSLFFGTFMIFLFYYIKPIYIRISVSSGILFILTASLLLYFIFNNYYVTGLIARRVFFIPALLDTHYFDFFKNKPLFWSASFLGPFIDYPYHLNPPHLIASYYFNKAEMSANNGIISNGFANLGWLGIMINITAVSVIFSFFNSLNINHKFYGLFFVFFITLLSSALPTVLLTHGGIILIFLSQFIMKDTQSGILIK